MQRRPDYRRLLPLFSVPSLHPHCGDSEQPFAAADPSVSANFFILLVLPLSPGRQMNTYIAVASLGSVSIWFGMPSYHIAVVVACDIDLLVVFRHYVRIHYMSLQISRECVCVVSAYQSH